MINIQDLSLLKITKIKPWAIYFDYDEKHYLLHGKSDGYESVRELFERHLNENGFWTLEFIKSNYGNECVINDYIRPFSWQTIVYNQISKEYFRDKLATHGFTEPSIKENNNMNELTNEELFYAAKFNLPLFANHYTELERKRLKEKAANYKYEEELKSEERKRRILFGE